jgi:hypothetical protein
VAVALHKRLSNYYHSHTIHDDHQLIHLRLKHLLPSDALLHVICWYLPGSGSTQLHALDLMSRYTPGSYSRRDNCYTTWQPDRHRWRPECQGGYGNASEHQLRQQAPSCSTMQPMAYATTSTSVLRGSSSTLPVISLASCCTTCARSHT